MHLVWNDEQQFWPIEASLIEQLEKLLTIAAQSEDWEDGEVALTFVDNERIHELNLEYRGIDRPTDVLSFSMLEGEDSEGEWLDEDEIPLLGDIVISVPKAIEQSEQLGHSREREIGFLFVHGFLHLIGYDHQDEPSEQEMFAKQEHILQTAGLIRL
jgi:probable rRNA maturation factor